MMRGFYPADHGAFWWVGGLFGLLITVAIVLGLIFIVREVMNRQAHRPGPPPPQPPLTRAGEELDLRYARGEIDRNEWLQRRADLLHGPGAAGPAAAGSPPHPPPPPGPSAPPPSPGP
jgi:putative membrane protein